MTCFGYRFTVNYTMHEDKLLYLKKLESIWQQNLWKLKKTRKAFSIDCRIAMSEVKYCWTLCWWHQAQYEVGIVNLWQRLRRTPPHWGSLWENVRKYYLKMISAGPKFSGNCRKPWMSSIVTPLPPAIALWFQGQVSYHSHLVVILAKKTTDHN